MHMVVLIGVSSFIRSKDMTGAQKFINGLRDPEHAHLRDS